MRSSPFAITIGLLAALFASPAAAEPDHPDHARQVTADLGVTGAARRNGSGTTRWYGWQIFLADAAVVGAYSASAQVRSPPAAIVATVGYLGGGPLVRALHGDGFGWSFLRRLTFPFAGALVGAGVGKLTGEDDRHRVYCSTTNCNALILGIIGSGVGMLAAMSYDWIAARETVPAEALALAWTPVVVVTPRTQAVGLALRF